jgi:hypothetical protein
MPEYDVVISRTTTRHTTIRVTADNEAEASDSALDKSYDVEFASEKDAERAIEGITLVKGDKVEPTQVRSST